MVITTAIEALDFAGKDMNDEEKYTSAVQVLTTSQEVHPYVDSLLEAGYSPRTVTAALIPIMAALIGLESDEDEWIDILRKAIIEFRIFSEIRK